ncbi:phenylacetate-CoA oxygenase subunit PaaJ [Microbispora siamensis]|uniref:Phenylacetate-CoA oxygenase subunit PaaJ n=1 Tax=Microbispora siamensis TaxID=564413 RepID=A0ABQ4GYR4_9ACTN|nr:phenylacetate-CoA oxygenase subunit PaaJ [Microbispora siamensis]
MGDTVVRGQAAAERVRSAVAAVRDPEIRVLTIEELGILRDVSAEDDGRVVVTITPTFLGCPAMDVIRADVAAAARDAGCAEVEIVTVLSPPWTTDWLSDAARAKLAAAGIAPPVRRDDPGGRTLPLLMPALRAPRCPRCGSAATAEIARAGSTACKALWRCDACRQPFDHVKDH